MSRHRHVRNMRYDDYDIDHDDRYDEHDYLDDDPTEEQSPYLWHHPSTVSTHPTAPPADSILTDLAAQFRFTLDDDTLQEAEIDAAIIATDYDVDAAMALLRDQRAHAAENAAAEAAHLELRTPSAIACMLQDDDASIPPPVPPLPPLPRCDPHDPVVVDSGAAVPLPLPHAHHVAPFRFDQPSPDDLIRARRAGTAPRKNSALRLPKASAFRGLSKPQPGAPSSASATSPALPPRSTSPPPARGANQKASHFVPLPEKPNQPSPSVTPKLVKQRAHKVGLSAKLEAGSNSVSVVVAGHVDAGKSTLLCHFLQLVNENGRAEASKKGRRRRKNQNLAWGTDEDGVERERGVTIDIATRTFETQGSRPRRYAMIDAPGHRDFVPAMILGATQASAALLVVDASPGEFEAGFCEHGQTREHALVLRSLGISKLIVVINKMDVVDFEEERYSQVAKCLGDFLGRNGWGVSKNVTFVPASGREGLNLVSKPDADHLMNWYKGMTVLEAIEDLPIINAGVISEVSKQPTRLIVSDFFRSVSLGGNGSVTGRLLCGSIAAKDKLLICPGGTLATVKKVHIGYESRLNVAVAGVDSLPISMGLLDLTDGLIIPPGSVLCDPEHPVPVVIKFRAKLVTVTTSTPLIQGSRAELHVGGGAEAVSITRLCEYVNTGKKRKPRRLVKGDVATVEITCERAVAMEKVSDVKALGRFALRQNGHTVGVGVVIDILARKKTASEEASLQT